MSKHRTGRSVEDTICTALMRDPDVASVVEQAVQAACAYLGSVIAGTTPPSAHARATTDGANRHD